MKSELGSQGPWNQAILDAEAEVKRLEQQSGRLLRAIRLFKQNRAEGVP